MIRKSMLMPEVPNVVPRVSVIMPTYNRARELPRSIRSVLSQTISDLELIIVDDASSDDTETVVESFQDSRIRYERLTKNVGGAEARNIGVGLAKADIIAFQDSDDEWTCSKLNLSLANLEGHSSVGAVFGRFIQVWNDGVRLMPDNYWRFDSSNGFHSLLRQNYVGTPTLVVKKKFFEMVGGFSPEMPRYQDWDLALKLAQVTTLRFLDEPTLLSYVTLGSISSNNKSHMDALEVLMEKYNEKIQQDVSINAAWCHRIGEARLENGARSALRMMLKAVRLQPRNVKYVVKLILALPNSPRFYRASKAYVSKFSN